MQRPKLEKEDIGSLSVKAIFPWARDALIDWSVIIAFIGVAGLYPTPITFILAVIVTGNRQHALAILGHDGTHFTLSKNRKINDILTNILTLWPLGLTVSGYRKLHFQHHKETGTESDPELHHKRARAPQWDLPTSWLKIGRYALMDLVGYSLPDYSIIVRFSKPESPKELAYLIVAHIVFTLPLLTFGYWWTVLIWYLSLVTSFMMFFRLRLWLEHQGTTDTTRLILNWWQAVILAPHNGWLHWEHHNWAHVPYYNLPKVRRLAGNDKIITLSELLRSFKVAPAVASGEALKGE